MADAKGTITQRLESVFDELQNEFKSLYSIDDFNAKMKALKKAGDKSDRPSVLSELYDMFELSGIGYEEGRDNAYYQQLIDNAAIPDFMEIEDQLVCALYNRFTAFPSPEEYMTRLVDRLSLPDDYSDDDTLRVKILKRFIKYGNFLSDAGFGGKKTIRDYVAGKIGRNPSCMEILQNLDDDVFKCLSDATKPQKKPEGKVGLLKACDDLATGRFHTSGSTQKNLYLFAMAFGMTYYSGKTDNGEIVDYKSDIEINLFRDYYATNLVSFMMASNSENACEYDLNPSGVGINYKNFAEMIYVYYISHDYSPQDKIRLSSQMIKRVSNSRTQREAPTVSKGDTEHYRGLLGKNAFELPDIDVLSLPEAEFEMFICENYNCSTWFTAQTKKGDTIDAQKGVMTVENEQNTAFAEYQSILHALEEVGVHLENCNYGLFITDVSAYKKEGYKTICDRNQTVDREKFDKFMELLRGINSFMGVNTEENVSNQSVAQERKELSQKKVKAMFIPSAEYMTRTAMIVSYYYYFNAVHEDDGIDKWKNFGELFAGFKAGIDEKLTKAHYQPLSGRNIFDVLVVFSSYAYINI